MAKEDHFINKEIFSIISICTTLLSLGIIFYPMLSELEYNGVPITLKFLHIALIILFMLFCHRCFFERKAIQEIIFTICNKYKTFGYKYKDDALKLEDFSFWKKLFPMLIGLKIEITEIKFCDKLYTDPTSRKDDDGLVIKRKNDRDVFLLENNFKKAWKSLLEIIFLNKLGFELFIPYILSIIVFIIFFL